MKHIFYVLALAAGTLNLQATMLEIINDASHGIVITDHKQEMFLLSPGEAGTLGSVESLTELYIYVEQDQAQQMYTLTYHIAEKFVSDRKTTLLFNDIMQDNVRFLHPNRFVITSGKDIATLQQKNKAQHTHAPTQPNTRPTPLSQHPHGPQNQRQELPQPPAPMPMQNHPAYGMHQPTQSNDISPELVQTILDRIKSSQQQTSHFQPPTTRSPQPTFDHPIGHRPTAPQKTQSTATHREHHEHTHHTQQDPQPSSSIEAAKTPPIPTTHTAGHHEHAHGHRHQPLNQSRSKREKNLLRSSKFMNQNKR